ncbi:DMT family transporter [Geotalea sp. SG265]|uniref:DMT family transporter n=1 Tax=Geotalea sp. SG265 TaxID=2922867 RepID=UPI001FAFDB85|nr:DMT family transporter [Geotalea sp. SG265]
MHRHGPLLAIISAILFGMSPVACKAMVGQMPSALLAGLLYLGSGLGLTGVVVRQGVEVRRIMGALSLRRQLFFAGAILAGGVAAPLFLAYGIRYGLASEVSLLLNFETVATTLLAWLIFHEQIGGRVWLGKVFIVGASVLVILSGSRDIGFSIPGLAVLAACFLWGVDNNLTRELEEIPASLLACIKGWSAGIFNIALSFFLATGPVSAFQIAGTLTVGALSYGASLVLFVQALREIGAARTSTWFASGPFIGTVLAVVVLGERPSGTYWIAALFMLSGMVFLFGERHGHLHSHEMIAHTHPHDHDEHHRHEHEEKRTAGKHNHFHVHQPLIHAHTHWPDIHHRHIH